MDEIAQAYHLLGIKPGATPDEVKQAYRDLVKVWHPDRFTHDERLQLVAQDKLKEINTAHELLQAHLAGELTTEVPAPTGNARTKLVVMLVLAAVFAAAGAFFFVKYKDLQSPTPELPTITNLISASPVAASPTPNKSTAPTPTPKPATKPYEGPCSLSFDGSGGHLEIATTGSLSGTFTVECWVMSHKPKQDGTVLSSRTPQDFGFDLKLRQGKRYHTDIGNGRAWLQQAANATFTYTRDAWHHVAYVVTPTDYAAYVDGSLVAQNKLGKSGTPLLFDESHRLFVGTDPKDNAALNGKVAELRVWSAARTAEQVKADRSVKLTGKEPGLYGWWHFTEGSGKLTEDGSAHEFWGKVSGNVAWSTNVPPEVR